MSEGDGFPLVDYDLVLTKYEDRLESMERGFGLDESFLDVWVPDDNHDKSIFYLFEAAKIRKQAGLHLRVSEEIMKAVDGHALLEQLGTLGDVIATRDGAHHRLSVSFAEVAFSLSQIEEIRGLSGLHRCYRDRLLKETRELKHLVTFHGEPSRTELACLSMRFHEATVYLDVDRSTSAVRSMTYNSPGQDHVSTRLLEILCRLSEGYPLQELSEHGVLRVEHSLRDPLAPPPVRGLITPETAGSLFLELQSFVRAVFTTYREVSGTQVERNTTPSPLNPVWTRLSTKERRQRILASADKVRRDRRLEHLQVELIDVVSDVQVYVDVSGYRADRELRQLVKSLERDLRSTVESRLEVYLPTAEDKLKRDRRSALVTKSAGRPTPPRDPVA